MYANQRIPIYRYNARARINMAIIKFQYHAIKSTRGHNALAFQCQ